MFPFADTLSLPLVQPWKLCSWNVFVIFEQFAAMEGFLVNFAELIAQIIVFINWLVEFFVLDKMMESVFFHKLFYTTLYDCDERKLKVVHLNCQRLHNFSYIFLVILNRLRVNILQINLML